MTFGLTPAGFRLKRLPDIQADLESKLIAEFGEINLDPQSVFGQLIGVESKVLADIWENLQDVYFSQYPNSAEGVALDNLVQLNGITRIPASRTILNATVTGVDSTLIPAESRIRIPSNNTVFFNPEDILISSTNANSVNVRVDALAAQIYTVVINSQPFSYSLPIITWTAPFVSGNAIYVTLNGVQLTPATWQGNTAATNLDVANKILAHPDVAAVGTPASDTITITPVVGKSVVINSIAVGGGVSQTGYNITYDTPASLTLVAAGLAALINNGDQAVDATSSTDTITIKSEDPAVGFSVNLGTNLTVTSLSSPGRFLSLAYGPIVAPANSVNEIITPIGGWTSVNNSEAGITGRYIETDAELRLRRLRSLRVLGAGTVEAIRARLLQNVPNVTNVLIFENKSMTQEDTTVTLSVPLITGNVVSASIDGNPISDTNYTTSHLNTIQIVANKLSLLEGIQSVTVGGTGNQTLTIKTISGREIEVTEFEVTGGASQPEIVIRGRRPPKSFEAVVEGGTDQAVANEIWLSKPAGIQTFGNVNNGNGITIIDSQGQTQVIHFSRAVPVYIWVQAAITLYPGETFPTTGQQQVAQAILSYGNSLGIGVDVLIQRVLAQIFRVPGIASGTIQLAATASPSTSPVFGSSDIIISESEISTWDLSRITVTVV